MRGLVPEAAFLIGMGLIPAFADEAQKAAVPVVIAAAPANTTESDELICRQRGRYYGSLIRVKICHTQREWDAIRKSDARAVVEWQETFAR